MARRPPLLLAIAVALACFFAALAPLSRQDLQAASSQVSLSFGHGGHARIPFDLRGQQAWSRGRLNGRDSVWIVVDTGASTSVMDQGLAREMGLEVLGEHEAMGAGGRQRSTTVKGVKVELTGLTLERGTIDAM